MMSGFILYLIAALAALGTLLIEYLQQAIASGGIIFVALSLIVCLWLFWIRRNGTLRSIQHDDDTIDLVREYGNARTILLTGFAGLISAAIAQLIHSPFLAWLTLLLVIGLAFYAEFGNHGLKTAVPVLVLMIFIKPIPAAIEPWLNLGCQSLSTYLTMIMLDFLKVFFFTEGNAIGLISQQSLATSLFDGTSWLYPSVFAAIAWGVYFQYHWLRTTLNVCQVLFWVFLWNAFGATVLLTNKEWGGTWMDSAPVVDAWKWISLALILFFSWSADQFFSSMFRGRPWETASDAMDSAKAASLRKPRWKLRGTDWILVIGLVAVCLLSIRLANYYGWGWLNSPSRLVTVNLPEEFESWKATELESTEQAIYGSITMPVRRWNLEKDGNKLTLEVRGPCALELPDRWSWNWFGWRIDNDSKTIDTDEEQDGSKLVQFSRLPGETCTLAIQGSNQYGFPRSANSIIETWSEFPPLALANLQRAIGNNPATSTVQEPALPAGHSVSLAWYSARPLDDEKAKLLRNTWDKVLPFIRQQLIQPGSK